jgi:Matrixin
MPILSAKRQVTLPKEPPPNGGDIAGDAQFDEAETWDVAIPLPLGSFDLVTLAAHEFGHSLGLLHSSVAGAIMRPTFAPGAAQRFLHQDDIDGIQSIYENRNDRASCPGNALGARRSGGPGCWPTAKIYRYNGIESPGLATIADGWDQSPAWKYCDAAA